MIEPNRKDQKTLFKKLKGVFKPVVPMYKRCFCNFILNILPNDEISSWIRPILGRLLGLKCALRSKLRKGIYYGNLKNIEIGYKSNINRDVYLDSGDKITIGKNVGIGYRTLIITGVHSGENPDRRTRGYFTKPVNIEDGAWIGAGVIIGPGVTIGAGCIVSAGSVVMRSLPPHTLVAGNPARVIKKLAEKVDDVNHLDS